MATSQVGDAINFEVGSMSEAEIRRATLGSTASHPRSFTKALFVFLDLVCIWLSAALAYLVRFGLFGDRAPGLKSTSHLGPYIGVLILYSGLVVLFCYAQRLYRGLQVRTAWAEAAALIKATSSASLLLMAFIYLVRAAEISRALVTITIAAGVMCMVSWRYIRRKRISRRVSAGCDCRNVLIAGAGFTGELFRRHLEANRQLGYYVKGYIDERKGKQPAELNNDIAYLGSTDQLQEIIRLYFIDDIFIANPDDRRFVKEIAVRARALGVGVRVIPDLYDGLAWGAPIEYLGQIPTISLHNEHAPEFERLCKRGLDLVLSATALVLLSPLFLMLGIAIYFNDRGPVLYRSARIGYKGKHFDCLKFRTMVTDAERMLYSLREHNERNDILFKMTNDPRITRLGRILRKYSLDELPQLWNVLKGEMSLVGPRPPLASEVAQYELEHLRRLEVKPGITGLWQVEARQSPSFQDYIDLDLRYIEHWNLGLDLKLLLKTLLVVLAGTGK